MSQESVREAPTTLFGPILALLIAVAIVIAGWSLERTWPSVAGLVIALLVLSTLLNRHRTFFGPAYRRWRTLSAEAQERMRDHGTAPVLGRVVNLVLIVLTLGLVVGSSYVTLRTETIRGADLSDPGAVFLAYNRVAAPELAELIELYVLRGLPLDNATSTDLRTLRNLYFAVEGYGFDSSDLEQVFGGLLWYRPYRSYPNDVDALPPRSQQKVEQILAVERRRAG